LPDLGADKGLEVTLQLQATLNFDLESRYITPEFLARQAARKATEDKKELQKQAAQQVAVPVTDSSKIEANALPAGFVTGREKVLKAGEQPNTKLPELFLKSSRRLSLHNEAQQSGGCSSLSMFIGTSPVLAIMPPQPRVKLHPRAPIRRKKTENTKMLLMPQIKRRTLKEIVVGQTNEVKQSGKEDNQLKPKARKAIPQAARGNPNFRKPKPCGKRLWGKVRAILLAQVHFMLFVYILGLPMFVHKHIFF
jgi:hypothetical protein